jgi:peptidoglycan biosynthesis protein MviN/MurJ (putative lipid II flippase)
LGITVLTLLLFVLLNHRTKNRETTEIIWFFLKVTAASVIAAGVCYQLTQALRLRIGWQTTLHALALLVIVSTVGFFLTALLAKLFRVREVDSYLAKLRF